MGTRIETGAASALPLHSQLLEIIIIIIIIIIINNQRQAAERSSPPQSGPEWRLPLTLVPPIPRCGTSAAVDAPQKPETCHHLRPQYESPSTPATIALPTLRPCRQRHLWPSRAPKNQCRHRCHHPPTFPRSQLATIRAGNGATTQPGPTLAAQL